MQEQTRAARRGGSWTIATIAVVLGVVALALAVPAKADAAVLGISKGQSCTITTHGVNEKGELIWDQRNDYKCYDTFSASLEAAGIANVSADVTPATAGRYLALANFVLGVHYDGASGTGTALTVTGSVCGGGGLNVPTAWNDRISSTWNGCPNIVHWEHFGYAGSAFTTLGAGNLINITGYMDNRTTSIKYYS